MKIMHTGRIAAVLALSAAVASTGCVTKKIFRQTVSAQDQKIDGVRTAVEENEHRIGGLKDETSREIARLDGKTSDAIVIGQKAGEEASYAEKLAKGTLLWEVTLDNDQVRFDLNRWSLKSGDQKALDDVVGRMKSVGHQIYVEVQGHTDSTGTPDWNMTLAQKRADAVRQYLHEQGGLPLHLIESIAYGETKPAADNSTSQGRAQNRRVVIRVLDPINSIGPGKIAQAGSSAGK